MTTLRLGAAQLHFHPAFEGSGKQPLREPLGSWEGAGLSGLQAGNEEGDRLLRALRERVEKVYVEAYRPRLLAVVRFAAGLELDLLVLPELSVPLALLPAVAEAAGARMTVVAGTHTVTAEGARKSGLYEALGFSPRPAIGSAVAPVLRGGKVIAAQAKLAASKWEPDLVAGQAWAPVALGAVEMGVLICIDFLKRGDGDVAPLVGRELDGCAVLAVPSLTPFTSLEHFAQGAEEMLYGYDRPVVYANRAAEGGTRVFTQEEDAPVVLAAGRAPALARGVEGVVAVEVRMGEAKQRYRPVVASRPLAAAMVMDAGVWGDLREAAAGVLGAAEVGEALDRVEAGREIWARAAAAGSAGGLTDGARERWRYLAGGAEGTTSVEHLRALARDVWVEGASGWREIEKGLVEGAARVLREVEKKAPEGPKVQKVTAIRGWLEGEVRGRFEGVEADGGVVEGVTEGLVPRIEAVVVPPGEDGRFERWVRDPGPFPERFQRHGFKGWAWEDALSNAVSTGGFLRIGGLILMPDAMNREAGLLALWGHPPAWIAGIPLSYRKRQSAFVLSDGRMVIRVSGIELEETIEWAGPQGDDAIPLALIDRSHVKNHALVDGLKVVQDEIRKLAHRKPHLEHLAAFVKSKAFARFVEPRARVRGGESKSAEDQLRVWLETTSTICILLGEFGTGKTTFARVFAARLAHAAVNSGGRPVIHVDLRAWSGPVNIAGLARRALGVDNVAPYRFAVEEGECVLIIDGFDEMSNRLTPAQLSDALRRLLAWRTPRSKILLTCRTHLFIDPADIDRVFAEATGAPLKTPGLGELEGATVLELRLFDKERIQGYLARVSPEPERAWEAMGKVHDLQNLAERPLLLDMIRENLPALTQNEAVTLGDLYETYVRRWAEWPGPDEWLTPEQKITFAEELAFFIWNGGPDVKDGAIRVDQLWDVLREGKSLDWIRQLDRDEVRLELRAGTFLVWKDGGEAGYYCFAHRSFMEYMLARRAVRRLAERDPGALNLPRFSPEVIAYCKERPGWEAAREEAAWILVEPYRARVSENALLLLAGEHGFGSSAERPWRLESAALSQVSLRAARLEGARLEGADLAGAALTGADLRGARLERAVLEGANLGRADLRGAEMKGAVAWGATLDGTRFEGADLRGVGFEGSSAYAEAPVLRGARLEGTRIVGTAWRAPATGDELCGLVGVDDARWRGDDAIRGVGEREATSRVDTTCHRGEVTGVAFSPEGNKLATACSDRLVRVWETRTGQLLQTLEGHTESVTSVAWTTDGEHLATGAADNTARIWNARTGRLLQILEGHTESVTSVAWTTDGEHLATGAADNTARVWDAKTGGLLQTMDGWAENAPLVAWTADGERLATGADDNAARVWETGTGRLLQTLNGHEKTVTAIAWAADGKRIATGAGDNTVRVWEAATGRLVQTLHGHESAVMSVAWAANGEYLATGSSDNTARVWEVATGRLVQVLHEHGSMVISVAWAADGKRLATGSFDKTARIWNIGDTDHVANFFVISTRSIVLSGIVAANDVASSTFVVRTDARCTSLELYADIFPAHQPIPSLHIPMDTAARAVSASVDAFLRPTETRPLPPIRSGTPTTLPAPWTLAPDLAADTDLRLTLQAILPGGAVLPLEASISHLTLPALPPGATQLLLTLRLSDRHERSFTLPLTVLSHNPYIAGPPVRATDLIGRDPDLARLHDKLRHGSIQLTGERRIGKTSLLHHLADHAGAHIPIWLDAQELSEPSAFRPWVTAAVRHAIPDAPADPADLLPYLRRLAASGKTPLLLVDEISHLQGLTVRDAAWLRSLSTPPVAAVLAGSPFDWSRFFASLPDTPGSPFNHLQDLTIGPLTDPEMRRLVTRPGTVPPDEEAMRRILELSGGRPYLAQRLCQTALDRVQREERLSITQADVDAAAREALVSGLDHQHKKRWAELAGAHEAQQALAAHARDGAAAPRKLYDALQEHGLFDGLTWTVDPAFLMWVREREAG